MLVFGGFAPRSVPCALIVLLVVRHFLLALSQTLPHPFCLLSIRRVCPSWGGTGVRVETPGSWCFIETISGLHSPEVSVARKSSQLLHQTKSTSFLPSSSFLKRKQDSALGIHSEEWMRSHFCNSFPRIKKGSDLATIWDSSPSLFFTFPLSLSYFFHCSYIMGFSRTIQRLQRSLLFCWINFHLFALFFPFFVDSSLSYFLLCFTQFRTFTLNSNSCYFNLFKSILIISNLFWSALIHSNCSNAFHSKLIKSFLILSNSF